ncbi:DUF2971 domain-containing protein [Vibrio metschnikovii]|nr:DUF2971 domain-containing protein [Vibrio metschnikovii]
MWSHYASQHSGMVVEFDITHDFFTKKFAHNKGKIIGKVNRVLYRKERINKLGESLLEPYFHKSDEWSYEKEHRLLVSIDNADATLIPKECKDMVVNRGYVKQESLTEFTEKLYKVEKAECESINFIPECMSMFKVPSEAIISVTFGCKSTPEFIDEVKSKLIKNNMNSLKLFRAIIDCQDYRLKFEVEKI